nr:hypothetical protein [uncultured Pseudomonas sp.]
MKQTITVNMMVGVEKLLSDNAGLFASDCSKEIGACVHSFKLPFSMAELPTATISVPGGGPDLQLIDVVSARVFDPQETEGDLTSIDFTLRGVESHSDQEVAKDFAYQIIHQIVAAEWKRYISPKDPRIDGTQASKIPSYDEVAGTRVKSHPWFDPDYEMSEDQWSSVRGMYNWFFYRSGHYLTFQVWRSQSEGDSIRQASYLFTVKVQNEQSFWSDAFETKDRSDWKQLLPRLLDSYRIRRQTIEASAEREGIAIDKSISDAPIFILGM